MKQKIFNTDRTDRIGTERIGKLLFEFSAPAIIGMIVNAIYNIVDRIYVGQGVDPLGIAGISVVMPLMLLLMVASMIIGIGANTLFSIRLGEGRRDVSSSPRVPSTPILSAPRISPYRATERLPA